MNGGITITLGDRAENHVGMQILGVGAERGYTLADLLDVRSRLPEAQTDLIALHSQHERLPEAHLLVIRGAVPNHQEVYQELCVLPWDRQYYSKRHVNRVNAKTGLPTKGVVDKHARYNLCFDNEAQEPDYAAKKGTVIALDTVPKLKAAKASIVAMLGDPGELKIEGNFYEDITVNGIGFHGDAERKKTVGLRLGASHDIVFQWFVKETSANAIAEKPRVVQIGEQIKVELQAGDVYIMTEKATGTDWMKRIVPTLRHAAGAAKFVKCKHAKRKLCEVL